MSQTYVLKEDKKNGIMHLFIAERIHEDQCYAKQLSICGKMDIETNSRTIFSCQPEKSARKQCAKVGDKVCGTCVGYLYSDGVHFK